MSDAEPAPEIALRRRASGWLGPLLALIALVALCGWAWWRFAYWPTTPQYALSRFFDAARAKDYDAVYDLVQIPGTWKALMPNGAALKAAAQRMPGIVPQVDDYRIRSAAVEGDRATVEATTFTRLHKDSAPVENSLSVRMVRTSGIWRIDGGWIASEMGRRGLGGLLLQGSGM